MSESDARWEEARELFLDLVELSDEARGRELSALEERDAELAREVRNLLRHDPGPSGDVEAGGGPRPTRFGPYEALRLIGSGGMGEVFVARRADGDGLRPRATAHGAVSQRHVDLRRHDLDA